jgi:hypothetical protein
MPMLAALVVSILAQAAPPPAAAACPPHLFILERTTNKNIVVYDAKRLPSGAFDPAKPAIAYWICNAEKGQREELTSMQWNRAYGFDTRPAKKPDRYRMTFKADFGRSFVIQMRDGCPVAIARIGEKKGIVKRIFVHVKTSFLVPSVQSVEIFGEDPETGAPMHEEFHP